MIEIIKGAFAAGEVKTFLIQGEYLEILEAAYPIDVAMLDRSGAQLSFMRNAEASYYSRPGRYEVVQVTSAQAQTVRIFVGSGDAGTRKTSGDVSVIDGARTRTLAGVAFAGFGSVGPLSANESYLQLWNPAGNTKQLNVRALRFGSSTATTFFVNFNSVELTTFQKKGKSKLSGGVESTSEIRSQISASSLPGFGELFIEACPVGITREIKIAEPIIVLPGFGLIVRTGTVNQDLYSNFEYYEEAI